MPAFRRPTSADQYEYLLRLYFGNNHDLLDCCIRRAYRDLNRTMHGFAKVGESGAVRTRAATVVRSFLEALSSVEEPTPNQASFDARHQEACARLCCAFSADGYADFRIGQAQKWLNMAVKYVYVFGEDRLPGYARYYDMAHIPIDNIILKQLRPLGTPRLSTSWSRINSYEDYMVIQNWIRLAFAGSAPLAVEFALWLDDSLADDLLASDSEFRELVTRSRNSPRRAFTSEG